MAGTLIKRQIYGNYKDHEQELVFRSQDPLHERKPTPEPAVIGDYRINFVEKMFGGYIANIIRTDGIVVVRGARISRFRQNEYHDPSSDTAVLVKLSLIEGNILQVTAFEEAKGWEPGKDGS
jgi:hypothetical protein